MTVGRIVVGIALLCSVVVISPAGAQTYIPHFTDERVQVAESGGTVVVTLRMHGPGRVEYRTEDGSCEQKLTSPSPTCWPAYARAPGDYGAVSGEVLFTEAGSRQITIPIVDDSQDEELESFTVWATSGPDWGYAHVSIVDNDGDSYDASEPAPATASSTTTIRRAAPAAGPRAVPPVPTPAVSAPSTPTTPPASDLNEDFSFGELRTELPIDLSGDEGPRPAPDRLDGKDGSTSSLARGLGIAGAVFAGAVVWMRQGRRGH